MAVKMSKARIFFVLFAILPLVSLQCTKEASERPFRRSLFNFSADLLRRISQSTDGHFAASTLSPYSLLSVISMAADGRTLDEIQEKLYLQKKMCYTNKYLQLSKEALSTDESATLERSSVFFVDEGMRVLEPFRRNLTATGVCEITPLNFEDTVSSSYQINDFVRSATHGIVDDMVTPGDLEGVSMMMIDALYFKGSWRTAFPLENTQRGQFFDSDGSLIGEVNLMYLSDDFNMTTVDPIGATVLELPYGSTERFSMLIFLPNEEVELSSMIENLKKISLRSVFVQFEKRGPQTISVQLPRFKISSDLSNMKELLIDMGIRDAFDPNLARFPELSEYQMYVSSFIQKADIEVTEEGTVAAAATELGFSFRSSMLDNEFIANKPFLFMIVDRNAEVPLFCGAYSTPTLY